jgi:hypothetical protein
MNRPRQILIALALSGLTCLGAAVCAQNRPKIDEGTVEVTQRHATITTTIRGSKQAARASNGVLFVLTNPDDAEVKVDGQPRGKAVDGEMRLELQLRRHYVVEVSAGPDYEPFKKTVMLGASGEKVEAPLTSKFGIVKMGPAFPDGAKLLIDDKPVASDKVKVDPDSHLVEIDGLTPGVHKITYDHPDYVIIEHSFKITPGSESTYTFSHERAVDELSVSTEPAARIYIDGQSFGDTAGDGRLKVNVPLGPHEVKLEKYGYEAYKAGYDFKFRTPLAIDRKLTPLPSSAEFHDDFDLPGASKAKWNNPASGWKWDSGRLFIDSSPAVGYPKDTRFRDFVMGFHLKLENGGGAAWAVRIKDSDNYYLFYLCGPEGQFPNRFLTYIVRDGKFDPAKPDDAVPLVFDLQSGAQYEVVIKANGNVIEHAITSSKTGKESPMGAFKDPDNYFPIGGIGFRTVGAEKFSVDEIFVQPPTIKLNG